LDTDGCLLQMVCHLKKPKKRTIYAAFCGKSPKQGDQPQP